jgi:hypothetical protein
MLLGRELGRLLFSCGSALLDADQPALALRSFALGARCDGSSTDYLVAAAFAAGRCGERDRAARYCERALQLVPELAPALQLLSGMFLHGEDYTRVIARMHAHLQPRTYVEIGVETGATLRLAPPGTIALGIDPQPAIAFPLSPQTRVFAEKSDDFFARRELRAELGGLPVELAFIDGMHHFEFALRDFINLERCSAPGSTILIHDVFPRDRQSAERARVTAFWSGDVWRLVVLLKKYRPDLSIHTIAAPPTGLAVVRNLDPGSRVLQENLPRLCEEFLALDYDFLDSDRAGKLGLFPNDWEKIRGLLAAS